jgi:hypothetical protein
MHIIINVEDKVAQRIKRQIDASIGYESIDEFISRAITNQLVLEESGHPTVLNKEMEPIQADRVAEKGAQDNKKTARNKLKEPSTKVTINTAPRDLRKELLKPPTSDIKCVLPYPNPDCDRKQPLFGIYNRIAPVKLSLRVLANIVTNKKEAWVSIEEVSALLAEEAPIVRAILEKSDIEGSRKRGDTFASAFPKADRRSIQRFTSLYLGYLSKEGDIPRGLLIELELANISKGEKGVQIGITQKGLDLMKLSSPIIDDVLLGGAKPDRALSKEEASFVTKLFGSVRPGELCFLRFMVKEISEGRDTPKQLRPAVSQYLQSAEYPGNMSDSVIETLRAGAISRLRELDIIRITTDGVFSTYSVNPDTIKLLAGEVDG